MADDPKLHLYAPTRRPEERLINTTSTCYVDTFHDSCSARSLRNHSFAISLLVNGIAWCAMALAVFGAWYQLRETTEFLRIRFLTPAAVARSKIVASAGMRTSPHLQRSWFGNNLQHHDLRLHSSAVDEVLANSVLKGNSETGPTHLVVLVHGLSGTPHDLAVLQAAVLRQSTRVQVYPLYCDYPLFCDRIIPRAHCSHRSATHFGAVAR